MKLKNKGIIFGLSSAIFWSFNTIILSILLQGKDIYFLPLFFAFLHDCFSSIYLYINLIRLKYEVKIFLKTVNKKALLVMIGAAILGGPLGMASYLMSTKYIGPSYSASISILYPVLGALIAKFLFHENLNKYRVVSICFSTIGLLTLCLTFDNIELYPDYKIGFLFSITCILGWALEGNIASYFMKSENIPSEVAIFIRQISSSIFYLFFVIPWVFKVELIQELFSKNTILLLLLASFLGSISYLLWYSAIDILGGAIGMLLNSTYVIWVVLIDILILGTTLNNRVIIAFTAIFFSIIILTKESRGKE